MTFLHILKLENAINKCTKGNLLLELRPYFLITYNETVAEGKLAVNLPGLHQPRPGVKWKAMYRSGTFKDGDDMVGNRENG